MHHLQWHGAALWRQTQVRLKWHPWSVKDGDHSCGLYLTSRQEVWVYLIGLGFGWDVEQPWRPWPQLSLQPTPAGHKGCCFVWCGVFLQLRRGVPG